MKVVYATTLIIFTTFQNLLTTILTFKTFRLRYFVELAYNGTNYFGWQKQPNVPTVQQTLTDAFLLILRHDVNVTGCGRTDTRVHAKHYVAHIDTDKELPPAFIPRINKVLPKDIVIYNIYPVKDEAHARFDATHRAYEYHLEFLKNPFQQNTAHRFTHPVRPDLAKLNEAAALLRDYKEFFPFCKTNNDANTMFCTIFQAEWVEVEGENKFIFRIAANRFLRGMVRLIVGMCLNVALDRISLEEVHEAMRKQERLRRDWSVSASGLYLTDIRYDLSKISI